MPSPDRSAPSRPATNGAYPFLKGHGTENDFVLLPDPDGTVHGDLDDAAWAARVRALCDRRAGLGGDGVLRVVRSTHVADAAALDPDGEAEWFMDYRNADGSVSEMCGNGVRVFARHLLDEGLVPPGEPIPVGTRGGVKRVHPQDDGQLRVEMGPVRVLGETVVSIGERSWPATRVDLGNPHAVVLLDDDDLDVVGDLRRPPGHDGEHFPDGVNVEFVARRGAGRVAMRVHERGSGETRSCGTGACAVQAVAAVADGTGPGSAHTVDVPGGRLQVEWHPDGTSSLTGPAVLVARGTTAL